MAQLFSSRTAFFSPLLPPSSKALWCHHGGTIATLNSVQQLQPVHAFFGAYGHEDELIERLTALDIKVLDVSYLYESVRHGTLLPITQFLFSAIKLAEERRQLDELVAVAEQARSPSSPPAPALKLSQSTSITPDTSTPLQPPLQHSQAPSLSSSPSSNSSQKIAEMLLPSLQPLKFSAESNAEREEPFEEQPTHDSQLLLAAIEEEPNEPGQPSPDNQDQDHRSSPPAGVADDSAYFEMGDERKATPELDRRGSPRQAMSEATRSNSTSIIPDSEPGDAEATRELSTDVFDHTQAVSEPEADPTPGSKEPSDMQVAEHPRDDRPSSPDRSLAATVTVVSPQQDPSSHQASSPQTTARAALASSLADALLAQLSSSQKRSLPSSEDAAVDTNAANGARGRTVQSGTMLEPVGEDVGDAAPRSQKKARFAVPLELDTEAEKHVEAEQGTSVYTSASQPVQDDRVRTTTPSSSRSPRGPFSLVIPSSRKSPSRRPISTPSTSAAEPASQPKSPQSTPLPTPHYSFYSALFLPSPPSPDPTAGTFAFKPPPLATPSGAEDVKPSIVSAPPPEIAIRDFFIKLPTALPELRLSEGSQSSSQSGGGEGGVRRGLRELRKGEGGFEAKKKERRK